MRILTEKHTVETSKVIDHKVATISMNPIIMHILSRDLYQKNVESPFREILMNSLDAHTEAGTEQPVEILLPSIWQETFSIRDFGKGLSHERFMDIYLDYGFSDKRENDLQIGGLGLGCKSPLAYTTSFSVESYHNGQLRTYLIFYNEDNLPCVDLISCVDTTKPSGLKVQFTTVSSNDFIQFGQSARNLLPRIPKDKYILVGHDHGITVEELELPKGQVLGPLTLRSGSGISIVMGFVAYKMELKTVKDFILSKNLTLRLGDSVINASVVINNMTKNNSIEITSSIGSYPVHPSREYVNITPRAITTLLEDIQRGINELFQDEGLDFEQDTFRFRLLGSLPEEKADLKVRARYIYQNTERNRYYWDKIEVPNQSNNYLDLISRHAERVEPLYVAKLTQFDMTDYLGNGRRNYEFPELFPKKTGLLVIDNEYPTDQRILDALDKYQTWNLDEDVEKFRKERTEEEHQIKHKISPRRRRTVVKSIQDPKHNILVHNLSSSGEHKVDWNSATHNVQSLKDLKKEIYWTATRIGCTDGISAKTIMRFVDLEKLIPKYKHPIIIGLPASRGTKTIEKTFKPLTELDAWIDTFLKSPYVQRRSYFHSLLVNNAIPYTSDLTVIKAYGPADWLIRLSNLGCKYGIVVSPVVKGPEDPLIKSRVKDIMTKFPTTRGWGYTGHGIDALAISAWAKQVTEFTNNKPTGAKSKHD